MMLSVAPQALRLDFDIQIEPKFDFLSDEYRRLFTPTRATAFQAPLWMDYIHRRLAAGLDATQHTLTVRYPDRGELVALIPLVLQRSVGMRILQPADFGVCDYNAVVGEAAVLQGIADDPALLARIDALTDVGDILMFRKSRNDGFDVGKLLRGTRSTPCENAAFHSDIGDDFAEWRSRTIRRKFSKELERLQRQTDRECGGYVHRAATTDEDIRVAFDFIRTARSGRFEGDLLDNPLYFEFYRDYAIEAAACGEAITYVSYVGGEPVAALFGLSSDGDFHAMLIASDTDRYARISPGTQIIYQVIRQRFDQGFKRFDMGLGNPGYKTHFRVEETTLRNFTRTRTAAGLAMGLVYHHAKPVKNFLRKYVPNVR